MKLFANVLTWILHPVVLSIPSVYLISYSSTGDANISIYWTFISLIFSGIVSLFVLWGVKRKLFTNIDISNRKQRIIAYPFVVGVVALFAFTVHLFSGPTGLIESSILFVVGLIILDFVNSRIKASIHVGSVAAFFTGIAYMYGGAFYILLLLIPLVAWARVLEKKHTVPETIVGAICGSLLTLSAIYIVQLL
jgi:membrane-associated phospholipid phosphatase